MITKALKLVARAAWVGWLVLGLVTLIATYGPWEARSLPAACPRMTRVVLPGAQDSSAAGLSLITFTEVSGFGSRYPLTGGAQKMPIPAFVIGLVVLLFIEVNIGGPPVVKHRDH